MSSLLVLQSLELVDPEFRKNLPGKKTKKVKNVFNLMPENQKITKQIYKKGRKTEKIDLLSKTKKTTIVEARQNLQAKQHILKNNLKKIKQIRKACQIELDKNIKKQIIERAVTKRPVKAKPKHKPKEQKTAFTDEDFEKFEQEYFG